MALGIFGMSNNQSGTAKKKYVITKAQAAFRQEAWTIIKSDNLHLTWSPPAVDAALAAASSMGLIQRYELESVANGIDGPVNERSTGLWHWCQRWAGGWKAMHSQRQVLDAEELASQMRAAICEKGGLFLPNNYGANPVRTFGFEAWVSLWVSALLKRVDCLLKRAPESLDLPVEDGMTLYDLLEDPAPAPDPDCIRALETSLRTVLEIPEKWDLFFGLAYKGMSLREIASKKGVSRSTYSRRYARPVVEDLRQHLGMLCSTEMCAEADLATIASCAAGVWSSDEFLAVCPSPGS